MVSLAFSPSVRTFPHNAVCATAGDGTDEFESCHRSKGAYSACSSIREFEFSAASLLPWKSPRAVFREGDAAVFFRKLVEIVVKYREQSVAAGENGRSLLLGRCTKPCCRPLGFTAPETLSSVTGSSLEGADVPRLEVWVLGVVLYSFLTGRQPFQGKSDGQISKRIKGGKVRFPFTFHGLSLSRQAKGLVRWMLAVDPKSRPSMKQILNHEWLMQF